MLSAITKPLRRFYSVTPMLAAGDARGEIPETKPVYRELIRIALPSVAEMVLMSLIGSVDTAMVGMLGSNAIAAVGLTTQPRMILLCFFFAINVGVTAVVARRKGEGRQEDANRTLRTGLELVTVVGALMLLVAVYLSEPLLRLSGGSNDTPEQASMLSGAISYFQIVGVALPINALTMCINAAQRGIGNTRITLKVNLISNLVNVCLNYLLIGGNFGFPALGIRGAAIATVIGYGVGLLLSIYSVLPHAHRTGFLHISFRDDWRPDKASLTAICKVGGNAVVEQIAMRVGLFLYSKMVAGISVDAFASHQICMQFLNVSFTFGDGIGVAGTSLVGQMLGRRRPDLAKIYGKASQRMALTTSLILMCVFITLRYPLVELFANIEREPAVIHMAAQVVIVLAIHQLFQTSSVVISGCLRGAGDTKFVARVVMCCVVVIRPLGAYIAIYWLGLGLVGAWVSGLIDLAVRLTFMYTRFTSGKWMTIKV